MKPLLHWTGSKAWFAPIAKQIWEDQGRLPIVEPFAGSAAITFACEPDHAWLNDRNPHLMNFYQHVQAGAMLDPYLFGTETTSEAYYVHRAAFNDRVHRGGTEDEAAASLFYYLNCHAFNHLCRFNKRGEFNVPYRRGKASMGWPKYGVPAQWKLTTGDWLLALADYTFLVADPPYDQTFSYGGFDWDEQVQLAVDLSTSNGKVLAFNSATERILKLYTSLGFRVTQLDGGQQWHHGTGSVGRPLEMLATNFDVDWSRLTHIV